MKPNLLTTLSLTAALATLLGCESPVENHWGEAYRDNKAAMIQNPEAGGTEPVEGLDPVTGKLVVERYEREQMRESTEQRELLLITD